MPKSICKCRHRVCWRFCHLWLGCQRTGILPPRLELGLGLNVLNTGVPALKPEHVEAYIKSILENVQPKIVLVAMRPNWMTPNPLQGYVQTMKRIHRTLEKSGIQMGLVLPPLASFDPKGRSNNAREVAFLRKELSSIPLLDTTPIFDANLPSGGVAFNLKNGMQQMVDRSTGKILAEGPQPAPPKSLAPEIIAKSESDSSVKEPLFYDGGHPMRKALFYLVLRLLLGLLS